MKKMFVALVCAVLGMSVNVTAQEPATVVGNIQDAAQSVVQSDSEAVLVTQDAPVEDTGVVAAPAATAAPAAAPVVVTDGYVAGGVIAAAPCGSCSQPAPMTFTAAPMAYAPAPAQGCCGQPAPQPCCQPAPQPCCQPAPQPCCQPAPANDCCCQQGRSRGQMGSRLRDRRAARQAKRSSSNCCCG